MGNGAEGRASAGRFPFVVPERYTYLGALVGGAQGQLVKLRDEKMRRSVALKILQAPHDQVVRRRFRSEVAALLELAGHPNVVTLYDYEETERHLLLFMEYCEQGSLADQLARDNPLPLAEVLRIGEQVAAGLAAAHARGIVHRDIKPGNLLRSRDAVKIADFGIATLAELDTTSRTRTGGAGTDRYTAPEVLAGAAATPASDVYSLAVTLTELAGATTADLLTADEPGRTQTSGPPLLAAGAQPVRDLFTQMLASPPSGRPTTATLASALQRLAQRLGAVELRAERPPGAAKPISRDTMRRAPTWDTQKHTSGPAGLPATGSAPYHGAGGPGRRRTWRILAPSVAALVLAGAVGVFLAFSNSGPKVPSPPPPRLAPFVPASQRVLRIYHVSLSGPVPEVVVTTTSSPAPADNPMPPGDLLLLGWDNYVQRWTLLYEAAKDPVDRVWEPDAYTSSYDEQQAPLPAPIFGKGTGVSNIRVSEIHDQPRGGADLMFTATVSGGNRPAQVTEIIHYNGRIADVVSAFTGFDSYATVIGKAPRQRVAVTTAWYTVADPMSSPIRDYRFILARATNHGHYYYQVASDNRPWAGVYVTTQGFGTTARVTHVVPGSPAAHVLKPGDVLVRVRGSPASTSSHGGPLSIFDQLGLKYAGDIVELQIRRAGVSMFVTIRLGTLADARAISAGNGLSSLGRAPEYML
jgi:serine/threonine protein kinase